MTTTTVEETGLGTTTRRLHITVAWLLLLLILIVAALLRFGLLGRLVLDSEEARQALAAWSFWQAPRGEPFTAAVSPAYFTFTAILMAFFGATDAIARLVPATFGLLTVALPWLWRSRLGAAGALATSVLLAVSPVANLTSARAGGEAISIFAALLLFIAWMRFRDEGDERWLMVAAGAFGLGLATSPLFYSLFIPLLLAWLLQRRLAALPAGDHRTDGFGAARRRLLAVAAAVFLTVATLLLLRPTGLGDAASQVGLWVHQFNFDGFQALVLPLLALVRYEFIVVSLGAAAIIWATWRADALPQLLVYWFAGALLLLLLHQGVVENIAALLLPAYLLLGLWLNYAINQPAGEVRWALMPTLFLLGAVIYFNGARYLRLMVGAPQQLGLLTVSPQQLGFLALSFVAIVSIFVAINFVRSWDRGAAYQGAVVGFLLLFVVYNWGTARWMLTDGGNDPREYWVESGSDDDVRILRQLVGELSWQSAASANRLQLLSAVDSPLLRWYLREFPNAVFGQTITPGPTQHVLITRADEAALAPGDNYLGTDLTLQTTVSREAANLRMTLTDTLRWWIFHEHPAELAREQIVLWARSDVLE